MSDGTDAPNEPAAPVRRARKPKGGVDAQPIPGTQLYRRRTPTGRPVCPVYKGQGDWAAACREAEGQNCVGFTFGAETFVRLEGKWYPLSLI